MTIYWVQSYSGNSPIINYLVSYKLKSSFENLSNNINNETISSDSVSHIIKNLQPQTTYLISLNAQNAIGQSEGCIPRIITTDEEAPSSIPRDIKAIGLSASSIQISWKRPISVYPYETILGYYVGYRLESESEISFKTIEAHSNYQEQEETCQITGLKKLSRYFIVIQAYNKKGAGPLSDQIQVQTFEFGELICK